MAAGACKAANSSELTTTATTVLLPDAGIAEWCYFGRLNADGSLDDWFAADADDDVQAIAIQADGKIVIGGGFDTVGNTVQPRLARVNADGIVDGSWLPPG